MPQDKFTYEDLLQLVDLIKTSAQFSEFHVKVGDMEVTLRRGGEARRVDPPALLPARAPLQVTDAAATQPMLAAPPPAAHRDAAAPDAYPEGAVLVRSPMVGSFFRAPEPGAPPFVEVGRQVEANATVCIIEVMKLMNSIAAGARGVVTHILAADAEPVEYGQVLMVIQPQ